MLESQQSQNLVGKFVLVFVCFFFFFKPNYKVGFTGAGLLVLF